METINMTEKKGEDMAGLAEQLRAAQEAADAALAEQKRVAELVTQALARGTRDMPRPKRKSQSPKLAPEDSFEAALRDGPITLRRAAATAKISLDEARRRISLLFQEGKVWNTGSDVAPRWIWIVGKHVSTDDLYTVIYKLMSERPMMLVELEAATGNTQGRIGGGIVRAIQNAKMADRVVNFGGQRSARWFLLPTNLEPWRIKTPR